MILSEVLFIWLVGRIMTQSSALWMSLVLVPTSMSMMLSFSNLNNFSGLMIFIIVMVFIGGLLVLLVGVSSTVSQEQSVSSQTFVLSLFMVIFYSLLTTEITLMENVCQVFLFSWLSWTFMVLSMIISILVLSLCLMTWLAALYKGPLRGL